METKNESAFQLHFAEVQKHAHQINVANGWWGKRSDIVSMCAAEGINYCPHLAIELCGLAHSEISEAVEAARKHHADTWGDHEKKDTLVRELAGTIVRLMDMAEYFNLPLAKAVEAEIEANRSRGFMHGGKAA